MKTRAKIATISSSAILFIALTLGVSGSGFAETAAPPPIGSSFNSNSSGDFSSGGNQQQQNPAEASSEGDKGYVIGASNLINIKVLGEEGLQTTYRVDEGGYITHPLLGRVKLMGLTVAQAEEMIRKALAAGYILDPNVTIFVIEHSHYSVLGEVRKPGNYEILGKLSVVEGISIAGGFTPVANEKKVKVLRQTESGQKTIIVNVKDILDGRAQSVQIEAGDVIEVEKSFF